MEIREIAQDLNEHAPDYAIGALQHIRRRIRGGPNLALGGGLIFHNRTIDLNGQWAFHYGGRSELQFNIGKETFDGREHLRFGVAFSLEPSQTLPDVTVLYPKIRRFNEFMSLYPGEYRGFHIWHWRDNQRSSLFSDHQIRLEYLAPDCFIFFGKHVNPEEYSYQTVLSTFDQLLPLYEYVEGRADAEPVQISGTRTFTFAPTSLNRVVTTRYSQEQLNIDVDLRHMVIQSALFEQLCAEYGHDNVAPEQPSGAGTRIDIAVRTADGYLFYEIKTGSTARACLREALGQLLEYSFWPGAQNAARLIVVGEPPLDQNAASYLDELQARFALPIEYKQQVLT